MAISCGVEWMRTNATFPDWFAGTQNSSDQFVPVPLPLRSVPIRRVRQSADPSRNRSVRTGLNEKFGRRLRAQSGPPSAGRWLAGVNRQLSVKSPLVGGPRFAADD